MEKPQWADAPEGANYQAQDGDGSYHWFEQFPHSNSQEQWVAHGTTRSWYCGTGEPNPEWHATVERRPE